MTVVCVKCGEEKNPYSSDFTGGKVCKECWDKANEERVGRAVEALINPTPSRHKEVGISIDNLRGMSEFLVKCLSTDFGQKANARVYGSAEYTPEAAEITEIVAIGHKDLLSWNSKKIVDAVATAAVSLRERTAKTLEGCELVEYCGDSVFGARVWVRDSFDVCVGLWAYVAGVMPDGTRVTEEKV
jgi:hypothetical protein